MYAGAGAAAQAPRRNLLRKLASHRRGARACFGYSARTRAHAEGGAAVVAGSGNPGRMQFNMTFRKPVVQGDRPLAEYVRLPAEKYNVLDADQIERVSDKAFIMDIGKVGLLGIVNVHPQMAIEVDVLPNGALQTLRSVHVEGRPQRLVRVMNTAFSDMTVQNQVTGEQLSDTDAELVCTITVDWGLPASVPVSLFEGVFSRALKMAIPWLLTQLEQDYTRWAAGDDTREALSKGEILKMAGQMAMDATKDLGGTKGAKATS